jgi:hypothetical protein
MYVCIWGFPPGPREGLRPFDPLINVTIPSACLTPPP